MGMQGARRKAMPTKNGDLRRSLSTDWGCTSSPMAKGLVYLASPYSHPNESVRNARFDAAVDCCGWLLKNHPTKLIYSPIAYSHQIALRCALPTDWRFWSRLDTFFLTRCSEVWVLAIEGFSQSRGIAAEREIAENLHLPVRFVTGPFPGLPQIYLLRDDQPNEQNRSRWLAEAGVVDQRGPQNYSTSP